MFHRKSFITAILVSVLGSFFYAGTVRAGGGIDSATATGPLNTTVDYGADLTFTVEYSCGNPTWTASAQLIDLSNSAPLGPLVNLSNQTASDTVILTFFQPGTYTVGLDIVSESGCSATSNIILRSNVITVNPAATTAISATTSTNVTVGDSVTFNLAYDCVAPWTYATAQLFNGTTMTNANKLGSSIRLDYPTGQNQTSVSTTKSITFNEVGTYTINASVFDAVYDNGTVPTDADNCEIANTETVAVSVRAAATTTTVASATSTTVAATTVSTTSLPKTGTDTNNALVALAVAIAGGAVILGRRRLITK